MSINTLLLCSFIPGAIWRLCQVGQLGLIKYQIKKLAKQNERTALIRKKAEHQQLKAKYETWWMNIGSFIFWVSLSCLIGANGATADLANIEVPLKVFGITFSYYCFLIGFLSLVVFPYYRKLDGDTVAVTYITACRTNSGIAKFNLDLYGGAGASGHFATMVSCDQVLGTFLALFIVERGKGQSLLKTFIKNLVSPVGIGVSLMLVIWYFNIAHTCPEAVTVVNKFASIYGPGTMFILSKVVVDCVMELLNAFFEHEKRLDLWQKLPILVLVAGLQVLLQPIIAYHLSGMMGLGEYQQSMQWFCFSACSTSGLLIVMQKGGDVTFYGYAFLIQLILYCCMNQYVAELFNLLMPVYTWLGTI